MACARSDPGCGDVGRTLLQIQRGRMELRPKARIKHADDARRRQYLDRLPQIDWLRCGRTPAASTAAAGRPRRARSRRDPGTSPRPRDPRHRPMKTRLPPAASTRSACSTPSISAAVARPSRPLIRDQRTAKSSASSRRHSKHGRCPAASAVASSRKNSSV